MNVIKGRRSQEIVNRCLKQGSFNTKRCICAISILDVGLGHSNCCGLVGNPPSLLKVRYPHGCIFKENRILIRHLRSQSIADGDVGLSTDLQHRSSCCLISNCLLCNVFPPCLPGAGMAGYHFDSAFPPWCAKPSDVPVARNTRRVYLNSEVLPCEIQCI